MELKKTPKADLQNKKILLFEIGLALSLLFVLVAFEWTSKEKGQAVLVAQHQEIVEEEEMIQTQQEPPPPVEIPKIPQIPDEIIIRDDDVAIPDFDFSESESNDNLFNDLKYVEQKQQVVEEVEEIEEIIPFAIVEEKPKFQGKEASEFTKWIYSKLDGNYPQAAQDNNIQGTVRVSFTVNTDGTLSDIKSIRKVDPLLEDAVIAIIKQSPKWTPGRQQRKPVKVPYQVPIVFKLQ
jgi:protein TonB